MKRSAWVSAVCVGLWFVSGAMAEEGVVVRRSGEVAVIENARVRVEYDLSKGTYRAVSRADERIGFSDAFVQGDGKAMTEAGYTRKASDEVVHDELGAGRTLSIECSRAGEPTWILEITLYEGKGCVVLAAGVENKSGQAVRVKEYRPLAGAHLTVDAAGMGEARTLNGEAGARNTSVTDGPFRSSSNDLLLTFRDGGQRRSVVLGGLTYHEFMKWAGASSTPVERSARQVRLDELTARAKAGGGSVVAYQDCGGSGATWPVGDTRLRPLRGWAYDFRAGEVPACFNTVFFDNEQVVFEAAGLDPQRSYTLGFSWWDYTGDGRVESVYVLPGDGSGRVPLLEKSSLPAFVGKRQMPEEKAFAVPKSAYAAGKMKIAFTLDQARAGSNAVVSEVWLWEGPADLVEKLPEPVAVSAAKEEGKDVYLNLRAADPVGRLVDVGERWLPDDRFYVDFVTDDPFVAMEQYGQAVRTAQRAEPTPYEFPTICSWYAGVTDEPDAQNHPEKSKYGIATTKGQVEEMDYIKQIGFLKYSPVALRLVPDNYTPNNPQGWWDDEHWRQQGFYVAPYETTEKWGQALQERGGFAFTYFQPDRTSADFRQAHPETLLAGKNIVDCTKPEGQAHLKHVYAAMRGYVKGMMFDYCDQLWANNLVDGHFADDRTTAAAVYRKFFEFAKEGLGPKTLIHERALMEPGSDMAVGLTESHRTTDDSKAISPELIRLSALRWYKNRVLFAYDMDAKDLNRGWVNPSFKGTEQDGRRMTLTMYYVAASRLLLANSFRDLSKEAIYDLERTVPYPATTQSARPVDAFVGGVCPRIYDYTVTSDWHQVTLLNVDGGKAVDFAVALSGDTTKGSLGLDARAEYYFYDFWNDAFAGKVKGSDVLKQTLRAGEARMLSAHRVEPHPQFLSTNRHIMQGYLDMVGVPQWNDERSELAGESKVVGGEAYKVVLALNGYRVVSANAGTAKVKVEPLAGSDGLVVLTIESPENATAGWKVTFTRD